MGIGRDGVEVYRKNKADGNRCNRCIEKYFFVVLPAHAYRQCLRILGDAAWGPAGCGGQGYPFCGNPDSAGFSFLLFCGRVYWGVKVRSLSEILFYQAAAALLLFVAGIRLQRGVFIEPGRFAFLFLCQFVKISVFMVFCNILFFRINELTAVYADLVIQALPPFAVGVLYDTFNWCSYSYVQQAGLDPAVMLCLLMAAGMLSYWYLEKLFCNYEVV